MNTTARLLKQSTTLLVASALLLQGCGSGGIGSDLVRSLSVSTSPSGADVIVSVSTELNAGNLIFPAINLPIVDPKNPNRPYGTLSLQRTLEGKNMLTVQVNVSRLSGNEGLLAPKTLPNGNQIPVAGVDDVIALQAGSSSRVYIGLNENSKMLGVAVAIKEFDSIAKFVPGANLFFDIPQTNGVRGLAGIFTGIESGTSGFGIFIDASQALGQLQMAAISNKVIGMNALAATDSSARSAKEASSTSSRTTKSAALAQASSVAAGSAAQSTQQAAAASKIRFVRGSNVRGSRLQQLQMRTYHLSKERRRINVVRD